MKPWKAWLFLLTISLVQAAGALGEEAISLSGEWRTGKRVIVIDQTEMKVRGSWKESYRNKRTTCSGVWFEGTISGNKISGVRHTCSPGSRPYVLYITIVNPDTLDVVAQHAGTGTIARLRRIK